MKLFSLYRFSASPVFYQLRFLLLFDQHRWLFWWRWMWRWLSIFHYSYDDKNILNKQITCQFHYMFFRSIYWATYNMILHLFVHSIMFFDSVVSASFYSVFLPPILHIPYFVMCIYHRTYMLRFFSYHSIPACFTRFCFWTISIHDSNIHVCWVKVNGQFGDP